MFIQTASEKLLTEARDALKREQAQKVFRAGSKAEREMLVRDYAIMIDKVYPAKRFYIGRMTPDDLTHTPRGAESRLRALTREYPEVPFAEGVLQ